MNVKYDATELDIEQLMLRIKESAAKRKLAARPSRLESGAWGYSPLSHRPQSRLEADLPDLKLTPEFKPHKDNHYHANDLLKFHDRHFIRIAYRAILKREADDEGLRGHLEPLRSGNRNKIDILASLRFSTEGRQRKVRVDGLRIPATVRVISRVPILGYFLQVLIGILRIPVSIRERRCFESYSIIQIQELADYANRLAGILGEFRHFINELSAEMAEQRHLTALLEQKQQELGLQENELLEHASALAELSEAVTTQRILGEGLNTQLMDNEKTLSANSEEIHRLALAMERIRMDLTMQQARSASLIKAIDKGLPVTPKQSDIFREEDGHMLDALYVSLEDHFRGGRSEIKERFEIYLPYLEQAGITTDILDLGCGRGEWLELLKEKGFHARGVDANRLVAEQCQAAGLKVTCGNAIDHLRSLPDNAISAVTSFHVIEHLEFKALVELIDEIVRTLRPGGLMVLETPNPENIIVGSCNFYLDPTHRHPLPIQTTKFLLEAKGLSDLKVLGLHTLESSRIQGNSELINRFNEFFYGPMDYAIIAHRK